MWRKSFDDNKYGLDLVAAATQHQSREPRIGPLDIGGVDEGRCCSTGTSRAINRSPRADRRLGSRLVFGLSGERDRRTDQDCADAREAAERCDTMP
jgi:hypothetical protein